jgi:hypothetical protein
MKPSDMIKSLNRQGFVDAKISAENLRLLIPELLRNARRQSRANALRFAAAISSAAFCGALIVARESIPFAMHRANHEYLTADKPFPAIFATLLDPLQDLWRYVPTLLLPCLALFVWWWIKGSKGVDRRTWTALAPLLRMISVESVSSSLIDLQIDVRPPDRDENLMEAMGGFGKLYRHKWLSGTARLKSGEAFTWSCEDTVQVTVEEIGYRPDPSKNPRLTNKYRSITRCQLKHGDRVKELESEPTAVFKNVGVHEFLAFLGIEVDFDKLGADLKRDAMPPAWPAFVAVAAPCIVVAGLTAYGAKKRWWDHLPHLSEASRDPTFKGDVTLPSGTNLRLYVAGTFFNQIDMDNHAMKTLSSMPSPVDVDLYYVRQSGSYKQGDSLEAFNLEITNKDNLEYVIRRAPGSTIVDFTASKITVPRQFDERRFELLSKAVKDGQSIAAYSLPPDAPRSHVIAHARLQGNDTNFYFPSDKGMQGEPACFLGKTKQFQKKLGCGAEASK